MTKTSSLLAALLFLLTPIIISAQALSGVTGVVTDSGGAVVPGVQVVLFDTKTSREVTATTNDQGVYTFNTIPPGEGYRLTFTKNGFQVSVINEVQLGIGKTETQNVELLTGQVTESVQITSTGGDATLNTTDASLGNIIGRRQLRELPIQIRTSPAALIGLQPGAIGSNAGTSDSTRIGSVTGSRADQGNITVDGIDANDQATGQAFQTVASAPIDSVQEFRAVTAGASAAEGRSGGGQIQLSTNSGTNDFHGNVREYFRTQQTAANTFFNNKNGVLRPGLKRHQFGGSLGGPIPLFNFGEGGPMFKSGKDKAFFFFDYEGRKDRSQNTNSITVPLQHFREGRIGYTNNNPGCGITSRLDTAPNCISFISRSQLAALDPQGIGANTALLALLNSRYPVANDFTGGDGVNTALFRFNSPVTVDYNIYTARADVNITESQRAFFRTTINRNFSTNAIQLFPGDPDSQTLDDTSYAWVAGHTWVISPSITNVATVGLTKQNWAFLPPTLASFPNFFNITTFTDPEVAPGSQIRNVSTPTYRDDVTWTRGSHSFQFGGSYKPINQHAVRSYDYNDIGVGIGGNVLNFGTTSTLRPTTGPNAVPLLNNTTARTRYDSAFALMLGRISNVSTSWYYDKEGKSFPLGTGKIRDFAYNEYEFYVQDNWRLRSNLTLNLGVRYHLYPAPYEKNGFQSASLQNYDDQIALRIRNGAQGIAGNNAEPFQSFVLTGRGNDGPPLYDTDKNNFAPRLGFSYNPDFEKGILRSIFGNRKTVLRGSASMLFDRVANGGITTAQDASNYIFDNSVNTNLGPANAVQSLLLNPRFTGVSNLPFQNTAPNVGTPYTPYVTAGGVPTGTLNDQQSRSLARNYQTPYSYQFSLGMQRELPGNMLLDVSWVGRLGKRQFALADASQVINFRDPESGQWMLDAFNALQRQIESGGAITNQPWIENQGRLARGNSCTAVFGASCTAVVVTNFGDFLETGGTADLVSQMYKNNLLRPNVGISAQFTSNGTVTNLGNSNYNGMLVSLQKRLSRGFEFEANYTWSHSIDTTSTLGNGASLFCDIRNSNSCRGDSDFDIRHLLNANGIWDLPLGRGKLLGGNMPKWLDSVIGGWVLSGVFSIRSGLNYGSASGSYSTAYIIQSPAVLNGDRSLFESNIRDEGAGSLQGVQYFADAAAANAALRFPRHGEYGSRNLFRGPNYWNIDAAMSKKFRMPWSENHLVTLRAEAYNLTNSVQFGPPNLTYNSATFGRITSTYAARVMQFALRYDF